MTQKQPNDNIKKERVQKHDIFISYRRLRNTDQDHRHSTSLARSVAQAFESKGFDVFFDCWQGTQACLKELRKSKYFIILVTKYSFEKGGGDNYRQEIYEIIKSPKINKDNIFLFNIDQSFKSDVDLKNKLHEFVGEDLDAEIIPFSTKSDFTTSINNLIKPEHGSKIIIKKFPRFSYNFCKIALPVIGIIAIIAFAYGFHQKAYGFHQKINYDNKQSELDSCRDSLTKYIDSLKLYKTECIVFAGGGTVQQYLNDKNNIDVKNYQDYPSKYIHLPSKDAWTLLWDDVNEGEEKDRTYCPIVLSTTKIDITEANIEKFKEKRRIVEYNIDSIPLMVQIFDGQNSSDPITLKSLEEMLRDTSRYEIWTTTERSGTYREYKEFLDTVKEFNLDNIVNNQKEGRKNFNPTTSGKPGNKTQLFLANQCYYYTLAKDKGRSDRIVVTDAASPKKTISVPLYVYTVAVKGSGDFFKLLPQADDFFNLIGCDTKKDTITERDSIVVQLDKQKIF